MHRIGLVHNQLITIALKKIKKKKVKILMMELSIVFIKHNFCVLLSKGPKNKKMMKFILNLLQISCHLKWHYKILMIVYLNIGYSLCYILDKFSSLFDIKKKKLKNDINQLKKVLTVLTSSN